jgi:cysteine desulfurase family protein
MIYFDNPATTFPKPSVLSEEIARCIKNYCGNPGRSAHSLSIKSAEKIFEARTVLAEMFGCSAENVVFTHNTTYALNIAIKGLVKERSHIVLSDIEHNAVLRPVIAVSREKSCSYGFFNTDGSDEDILESIKASITENTSLLICTHISNIGCRRLPIEKIGKLCKEKGITFIVDGAQSAGIHEINVQKMHISALCIPAHKGLYGPQGLGMILFGEDVIGRTIIEGGTGISSLESEMPDFLPERYEAGTLSTPLICGLTESLKWLKSLEIKNIRAHEEKLYRAASDIMSLNDNILLYPMNEYDGNTLCFNVKGITPAQLGAELNKRDICVRSGYHCAPLAHKKINTDAYGAVRIGFSVFNTQKEVYAFYEALCDIIKKRKKPII